MVRTKKLMSFFWRNCMDEHNAKDPNAGSTDNQLSVLFTSCSSISSLLYLYEQNKEINNEYLFKSAQNMRCQALIKKLRDFRNKFSKHAYFLNLSWI